MFERYYKELIGYFSRTLNDTEQAQDVVQETYLRISAMGERANAVLEPRAFLYQTAKRIIIDEWRKKRHFDVVELREVEQMSAEHEEPLEQLLSSNRMKILYSTINALPPRSQEAFKLHKFEGLSHKEIALKMGISKNAVEKLIMRALLTCKNAVDTMHKEDA